MGHPARRNFDFHITPGDDGHRVFSFPAVVAPYAGTMTAVYAWYPGRFNAKDGFRMGNYSLLGYLGGNIALEFIYSGSHSLLSRMHLNNGHGVTDAGSDPDRPPVVSGMMRGADRR